MNTEEQQFLNDLDKRLWNAADRLRSNVNPSDYMHVVLGLVFLKYISDAFKERRAELEAAFKDPDPGEMTELELEARDYYLEKKVFWVPALARWDFIKTNAKVDNGTKLQVRNGKTFEYEFKSIGRLLDDALEAVEEDNPKLKIGQLSVYGQEANPTTWRLASMNMAIRGLDFDFGKEPASTYTRPQHPDLRADYIMANPPFNMKAWKDGVRDDDVRWKYGVPPDSNANFAWMQHMIHHLAPHGSMALLLANGSMSSNTDNEGEIRRALIEGNGPNAPVDLVECMVALPGQWFTNTQIPACIWFLTRSKSARDGWQDRRGKVLFIDARNLGYMKDRVLCDFKAEDIAKVASTFHRWKRGEAVDEAGFAKAATLDDIRKHEYVLTPGRYVGAAAQEEDGEPFEEKMARLTATLSDQFAESAALEATIRRNLAGLGYPLKEPA